MEKSFTSIIENPHFNQFAAILSIAMSPKWRMSHPEVPSVRGTLEHRLSRLNRGMLDKAENIKRDFLKEWARMLTQIVEADPRLRYSPDDLTWFVEVIDGDASTARVTFSMLFAVASTRRNFYSIEDIAAMTGESAQTWRKHAASGEIIGAFQTGKTWVIPELSLRAYGIKVPGNAITIETEE